MVKIMPWLTGLCCLIYMVSWYMDISYPAYVNIVHYTNLVLTEACWHIKQTPVTSAYTTFDEQVAITQRADCFRSVYNLIIENIQDATPTT
jgi:hypothetical protein